MVLYFLFHSFERHYLWICITFFETRKFFVTLVRFANEKKRLNSLVVVVRKKDASQYLCVINIDLLNKNVSFIHRVKSYESHINKPHIKKKRFHHAPY